MSEVPKKYELSFVGDAPMQLTIVGEPSPLEPGQGDPEPSVQQVALVIKEYLRAAKSLLEEKYVSVKALIPSHLAEAGNVLVICCPGGAVVRYEGVTEKPKIAAGWMSEDLSNVVAILSQQLVYCHQTREFVPPTEPSGMQINLAAIDPVSQTTREIASGYIRFDVSIERPQHVPAAPSKPFCPLSIRNNIDILIEGELVGESNPQRFMTRTPIHLPVGWKCIEVFPSLNLSDWKPEYAPVWAENDILAAVVAHQLRETSFQSLDPNAAARNTLGRLLAEFRKLLDSEPDHEEVLQSFLREHPVLLCPAHVKMWPKLALGAHITDFVFREANYDYQLVELERSTCKLFRADGHQTQSLTVALGQIADWKRYLQDNLRTVQDELSLERISANPKSLVVIGRSHSLSKENLRKLAAMHIEHPRTAIWTYDDVHNHAKAVIENLLGPIWDPGGSTKLYLLT